MDTSPCGAEELAMIALIPARAGSKRLPGKNTRLLAVHPLIAYTIAAAQQSRVFSSIHCCTDDPEAGAIASGMGCAVIWRLPVPDDQPDIVWVREAVRGLPRSGDSDLNPLRRIAVCQTFAILRPTSPFRTAETIRRAMDRWTIVCRSVDSLRMVEPVTEHPGKMWSVVEGVLEPVLDRRQPDGTPWHSSPTQTLPLYYKQTAGLEMSWASNLERHGTISGRIISPFFSEEFESLDLNTPADWERAEALVASGAATLPSVSLAPVSPDPETSGPPDPRGPVSGGSRV